MSASWFHRHRPETFHAAVAAALTLLLTLSIRKGLPGATAAWVAAYLVALSLVAFGYYGLDKWQAQRAGRRVPEVVLHGMALLGGSPGAYLAMRTFRHKTVKAGFRRVFWLIVVLQAGALGWLAYHLWRAG